VVKLLAAWKPGSLQTWATLLSGNNANQALMRILIIREAVMKLVRTEGPLTLVFMLPEMRSKHEQCSCSNKKGMVPKAGSEPARPS
jgi:hypothetical protein